MAITQSGGVDAGFGGDPRTLTLGSALAAGETLIVACYNSSALDFTSATCGGNAMTRDLDNAGTGGWRVIYRYYSASGGETSCSFNTGSSIIGYFTYVVDDEIDNSDPIDTTVSWADSGEGFAIPHQFDFTAGVPAAGGLAVCGLNRSNATGTSGSSVATVTNGAALVYKAGIASGAGALNFDLSGVGLATGMIVIYNYASSGSYTITANSGSYSLSGQSANPLFSSILTAAQGSYALTGIDTLLVRAGSYQFTAEAGAYTLVGANALVDVSLNAEAGSYTLTGQDTTLNFAGFTNPTLTAEFGSYVLTGQTANTLFNLSFAAEVGVYALTGRQAGLTWSGAPAATGYASQKMTFSSLRISL